LRGTIKKICNEEVYKAPATIEDPSTLVIIEEKVLEWLKTKKGK